MKKLFLIIPVLFLGCTPYHHGDWAGNLCITPGFTDNQSVLLYQATQEWRARSDDSVNLKFSILNNHEENGCDAVVFPNSVPPGEGNGVGVTEYPAVKGYTVYIYIDPALSVDDQLPDQENSNAFYAVALHEFGHYLGAEHSPYCNDIMYWKVNAFYHLSDNDVSQLWNPYPHGKYDNLNYCLEPMK